MDTKLESADKSSSVNVNPTTDAMVNSAEDITPASPIGAGAVTGKVTRSAGIVGLAVMGSRLLGLVREQVFAKYFGASREYDAFTTAFRISNLLRDLFAEGALSAAFVTTFSQYLTSKGERDAWRLANLVLNALILVLAVITLLAIILAPQFVDMIAPGFRRVPGKTDLTIELTRIMFPFIILVAMAAVAMGILNTRDRFGIPASASSMFNIGSIVGGLSLAYWLDPSYGPRAMVGMAIGTLMGGALQFLFQAPSLYKVGFRYTLAVSFTDPGVRKVVNLMAPAVIGAAAVQVNVFINNRFASPIEGAVSWLNYAFRLMQFPIGIFGVAISTATLPTISRAAARGDINQFRHTLASSLGLVFFLCIPSACGLIILGEPVIGMIYQRGRFSSFDTQQTAAALALYALGLAGYAAIKVLAPAFYALDDVRTPMIISLASIATNYTLNWLLVGRFGHRGLALSTSGVALLNFIGLFLLMRRRLHRVEGRRIAISFLKIIVASGVMSVACWWTYQQLLGMLGQTGLRSQVMNALIPIGIGGIVFLVSCKLLKVSELDMAIQAVSQKLGQRSRTAKSR